MFGFKSNTSLLMQKNDVMDTMTTSSLTLDTIRLNTNILNPNEMGFIRTSSDYLLLAEEHLQNANKKIAQAQAEAENSGFKNGMNNAKAEKAEALMQLEYEAAKRWSQLEDSIVQLAISVVRRIAFRLGSENFMPALAETALAEVKKCGQVVLRVSPLSVSSVAKHLNNQVLTSTNLVSLEIRSDASLDEFACVLETDLGFVAADLDIQLVSIEKFLSNLRIK